MTSHTDAVTIKDELRGKLFDAQRLQKIDGCRRCQQKNHKLRCAADAEPDPGRELLEHGDDVVITAVYRDDLFDQPHWTANSVYHRHHPRVPFDDVIVQGTDQALASARIHVTDTAKHLIDVDVIASSPAEEGPAQSVVDERQQQYRVDDDRHPDGMNVIDRAPSDAPATWPDAELEWLRQLEAEYGPLELPVTKLGTVDTPIDDSEPGI